MLFVLLCERNNELLSGSKSFHRQVNYGLDVFRDFKKIILKKHGNRNLVVIEMVFCSGEVDIHFSRPDLMQ